MLKHLGTFALLAVCLFAIAMGGCKKTTKPIEPPKEDPLELVSADPAEGSTIQPDATITVTFNRASDDPFGVALGTDPDKGAIGIANAVTTGNTVTITGYRDGRPFKPGHLEIEIWGSSEGRNTRVFLNYTVAAPPPTPPKEKTFKEQLEGEWSITKGALSDASIVPDITDEFAQAGWFVIPSLFFYNTLQFDASGEVVLIYYVQYVNVIPQVGVNINKLELTYTVKGSYELANDSGTSATMTLSFATLDLDVKPAGGNWVLPRAVINGGPLAAFLGNVLNKERVSISGDELRLGQITAER